MAFLVLVCSKLYLVTQGALVPEMAAARRRRRRGRPGAGPATPPLNARLTLLGTLAGFVVSIPAVILYKLGGSPAVLISGHPRLRGAAVAGARLPRALGWPRPSALWTDAGHRRCREYGEAGAGPRP